MRRQLTLRPAFCLLFALPALALRGDEREVQRERLVRTVGSLATYRDLERRLDASAPDAPATRAATLELLSLAEPGPDDPARAEVTIAELRSRVNALQEILDARAGRIATRTDGAGAPNVLPSSMPVTVAAEPASGRTALEPTDANVAQDGEAAPAPVVAQEFIADRKRLGRACWRGGRYQEGVAALEPLAGDPQADYWRARCLEKLARPSEAIELYRRVIEVAAETPEGRSAREDCEFLEWSLAHGLVADPVKTVKQP